MDLSNYESMDPHLLVGVVNTAIRNHCDDLEDLCKVHDMEQTVLVERLNNAGYDFMPEQQQFR
ncbi:MAG: DUF4250 domain-containing protein [Coraliomargarita sp.]